MYNRTMKIAFFELEKSDQEILSKSFPGAEVTFGLILDLSRNIIKANKYIRGTSNFHYFHEMEGFDLAGKTLGIIGTGKIGKNVLKIAKGLAMNVVAHDLFPDLSF